MEHPPATHTPQDPPSQSAGQSPVEVDDLLPHIQPRLPRFLPQAQQVAPAELVVNVAWTTLGGWEAGGKGEEGGQSCMGRVENTADKGVACIAQGGGWDHMPTRKGTPDDAAAATCCCYLLTV